MANQIVNQANVLRWALDADISTAGCPKVASASQASWSVRDPQLGQHTTNFEPYPPSLFNANDRRLPSTTPPSTPPYDIPR